MTKSNAELFRTPSSTTAYEPNKRIRTNGHAKVSSCIPSGLAHSTMEFRSPMPSWVKRTTSYRLETGHQRTVGAPCLFKLKVSYKLLRLDTGYTMRGQSRASSTALTGRLWPRATGRPVLQNVRGRSEACACRCGCESRSR